METVKVRRFKEHDGGIEITEHSHVEYIHCASSASRNTFYFHTNTLKLLPMRSSVRHSAKACRPEDYRSCAS